MFNGEWNSFLKEHVISKEEKEQIKDFHDFKKKFYSKFQITIDNDIFEKNNIEKVVQGILSGHFLHISFAT